jgi:hypothetical protein
MKKIELAHNPIFKSSILHQWRSKWLVDDGATAATAAA